MEIPQKILMQKVAFNPSVKLTPYVSISSDLQHQGHKMRISSISQGRRIAVQSQQMKYIPKTQAMSKAVVQDKAKTPRVTS